MATRRTPNEPELPRIYTVRRLKVVLDVDLAKLYAIPTKRLNEAVLRKAKRFPAEFCFVITKEEVTNLKSQFETSSGEARGVLRSQIATLKTGEDSEDRSRNVALKSDARGRHRKYLPRVFTEHGALMAANVLRSEKPCR